MVWWVVKGSVGGVLIKKTDSFCLVWMEASTDRKTDSTDLGRGNVSKAKMPCHVAVRRGSEHQLFSSQFES